MNCISRQINKNMSYSQYETFYGALTHCWDLVNNIHQEQLLLTWSEVIIYQIPQQIFSQEINRNRWWCVSTLHHFIVLVFSNTSRGCSPWRFHINHVLIHTLTTIHSFILYSIQSTLGKPGYMSPVNISSQHKTVYSYFNLTRSSQDVLNHKSSRPKRNQPQNKWK